ncbi:hypothetical protein FACS1894184_14090 [Clostridia bacterium]|nr:hypothetical protein FACS1894184_14090 [Clostridia bacterium]
MYNQEYQMPQQPQETPNTPPDTQQSAYIQTGQSAPTLSPFPPFGITTATVTMRKSPNLQGDYMLKIPSGEVIEIIYAVNGWYQTRRTNANGTHTGWVSSIYIAPYTPNNSGQAPSYQASVNQPIYSQQYPQPSYTHQQASDQAHTMHGKSNAPHLTYPSDQSAPNIQPQPTQPPIQEAAPGVPTYNAYPAQPGGTTVTVNVSQSQDVKK